MAISWATVRDDAISAVKQVLGGSWSAVSQGATNQISLLVQTAQYINQNKKDMTDDEYQLLITQQKIAMQNVLTAYESIGIATAQNAVAAVIKTILNAVPSLTGIA